MKKDYKLTKEEQELLEEVERGEWLPVKNQEGERQAAIEAARNTLQKKKNINIRLSERTLMKLKNKAAEEGLPYQTLASSILHKYVNK